MESRQVVGFAFEPEYSEEEIARMKADRCTEEAESSDETDDSADHAAGSLENVDWCSCDWASKGSSIIVIVFTRPHRVH